MSLKFHHIAIATPELEKTSNIFDKFGFIGKEIIIDPLQNVKIKFTEKDNIKIELVEPANSNSPINNIIKKNGVIPYHLCFSSDDFLLDVDNLMFSGFVCISKPVPAVAINNKNITFLYHADFGLVEIVEE